MLSAIILFIHIYTECSFANVYFAVNEVRRHWMHIGSKLRAKSLKWLFCLCSRSSFLVVRPAVAPPCPSRALLLLSRAPPPSASPCWTAWVGVWAMVWGPSVRLAAPLCPWWAGSWRPSQEALSWTWTVCWAVWTAWSSLLCRTPLSPRSPLCVPSLHLSTPRHWHRAFSFPRVWARTYLVCL